jgi:hypothetical protein
MYLLLLVSLIRICSFVKTFDQSIFHGPGVCVTVLVFILEGQDCNGDNPSHGDNGGGG